MQPPLQAIPTHIITGFLGVGKSTTIQSLLARKPVNERWAVLVNEFGEIGVDGALLSSNSDHSGEVFIREVAGGCLCCAASVPFQVALNQLLKEAQPDRLLIEPTGLGHPQQIIRTLLKPEFQSTIDLHATLTLVDARKLQDPRYREHPTFRQQLQIADLVVAHKADLYRGNEVEQLRNYLKSIDQAETPIHCVSNGAVNLTWLSLPRFSAPPSTDNTASTPHFHTTGWRFTAEESFDFQKISAILAKINPFRLKAVLHTNRGPFAFNLIDGELTTSPLPALHESRIEIIDPSTAWSETEIAIGDCLLKTE